MVEEAFALTQARLPADEAAEPRETLLTGKLMARALAEKTPQGRTALARRFIAELLTSFWDALPEKPGSWAIMPLPDHVELGEIPASAAALAERMGIAAAQLPTMEAGYLLGSTYTAMLPDRFRADYGVYYTPPALCERLLDMAEQAGELDWTTARVLDPACGGGAFLSPVAERMLTALAAAEPGVRLRNIAGRLTGFELDPFAAWFSQVLLEITMLDTCTAAGMRLPPMVEVCDSLEQEPVSRGFDLVVGNPPYGRITLRPELRARYQRSLFGHANLYGVFTDLALRYTRLGGVIAYVTPTSFLAGE